MANTACQVWRFSYSSVLLVYIESNFYQKEYKNKIEHSILEHVAIIDVARLVWSDEFIGHLTFNFDLNDDQFFISKQNETNLKYWCFWQLVKFQLNVECRQVILDFYQFIYEIIEA